MIPEAELIEKEIVLRQLKLPPDVKMARSSLLRWFSLSLGLISPEETRQTAFLVLDAFLHATFTVKRPPTTLELKEICDRNRLAITGSKGSLNISEKLIRYHMGKLIELGLVERKSNRYFLSKPSFSTPNDYSALFEEIFKKKAEEAVTRSSKAFQELVKSYTY